MDFQVKTRQCANRNSVLYNFHHHTIYSPKLIICIIKHLHSHNQQVIITKKKSSSTIITTRKQHRFIRHKLHNRQKNNHTKKKQHIMPPTFIGLFLFHHINMNTRHLLVFKSQTSFFQSSYIFTKIVYFQFSQEK